jgi:hypothetical protein
MILHLTVCYIRRFNGGAFVRTVMSSEQVSWSAGLGNGKVLSRRREIVTPLFHIAWCLWSRQSGSDDKHRNRTLSVFFLNSPIKFDYLTFTVETVSLYNKNQITEALLRDTVTHHDSSGTLCQIINGYRPKLSGLQNLCSCTSVISQTTNQWPEYSLCSFVKLFV